MNKHIVRYLDVAIASVIQKKSTAYDFCDLASAKGMKEFANVMSYRTEAAALSDLQKEFRKFFQFLLNKYDAVSPAELTDAKKKELFEEVKSNWTIGKGPTKKWMKENEYE